MIKTLALIEVICLTADGWSAAKRSFLGVTAHWLDENNERQSMVLACKRIIGRHTHDNLAKHLEEVIEFYGLFDKVGGGCVTDSAANFVKCFKVFGLDFKSATQELEQDDVKEQEF